MSDETRRLHSTEVSDFLENPVWRAIASQIEIQRRKDIAQVLDLKTEDLAKINYLRGQAAKAEQVILLPQLLEKKLRGLESAARNEYTDEDAPVDLA